MIQVQNIAKSYGSQCLFDGATFTVGSGEKIGLVGRNGSGKSTIFKIILGQEEPDSGQVLIPAGYQIGHLSQHLHFTEKTVLAEGCSALPENDEGVDQSYQAKSILLGLGFSEADFAAPPQKLSGGFQVRLNLAKLLVSKPNLILLDEPTNYLDIVSIRWLARFLRGWKDELILITHERDFLEQLTTHTLGIHRQKLVKIAGGPAKLKAQIEQDESVYEQTRVNEAKKREQLETFINRFRAKASKASAVQSKIKALERKEQLEELQDIEDLEFKFNAAPFPGKWLIEASDLSFAYPGMEQRLFKDLSFAVARQDRIAVIGKNGKGKSTLLKVLAKELKPDEGLLSFGSNLKTAYFGQMNIERLNPEWTVEEEILAVQPDHNRTIARTICGLMMFSGDDALKKVKVLSGGERSRVLLGKILVSPANLLLLDEPTNHLDLESTQALMEAVNNFSGAVILVTHSETILSHFADRLIIFDQEKASLFEGTYNDFLRRIGWQDESDQEALRSDESEKGLNKKELRKKRAEIIKERGKVVNPLNKKIEGLEEIIIAKEAELDKTNEELLEVSKDGFGDAGAKLAREVHKLKAAIEERFNELEELTKKRDEAAKRFDIELEKLSEE